MRKERENVLKRVAAQQKRQTCAATRQRLNLFANNMDDCLLYHLAWDLDLLVLYTPRNTSN